MSLSQGHETERKTFETKMKAEYKLKKERWKREMESQETPKSQRNQGEKFLQLPPLVVPVTLATFFPGIRLLVPCAFLALLLLIFLLLSGFLVKAEINISLKISTGSFLT